MSKVTKLTTNFGDQMTAYLQFSFSIEENPNPQPGQGGDDVVIEGGTIDKNETEINPIDAQVSEQIWNQALNFSAYDKIGFTIDELEEIMVISGTHYEFEGNKACKHDISYQDGGAESHYYSKEGSQYYYYQIKRTDIDMQVNKLSISQDQYNQEIGKVKIDFSSIFQYENFYFNEQANCYVLNAPMGDINYAEFCFYKNKISGINIIVQNKRYSIHNFHFDDFSVNLPPIK